MFDRQLNKQLTIPITHYPLPMKVKDLIHQLAQLPPETEIHFEGYDDDEATDLIDDLISASKTISCTEVEIIPTARAWELLPLRDK